MGVKHGLLLRKELGWRVFEYRVLRRIFGPGRIYPVGTEEFT
jgi:hypothetical protein